MVNFSELVAELRDDPAGIGYTGEPYTDEELINARVQADLQDRDTIPMWEIYGAIDWAEFVTLSDAKRQAFQIITSTDRVDATSANMKQAFATIFQGATNSIAGLVSVLGRPMSRAEVLWGVGVRVRAAPINDAWEVING